MRLKNAISESYKKPQSGSAFSSSTIIVVSYIQRYKEAFPELYRLGAIAISLPVSTASCERSFSALRHIKTWVRNSISNDKLQCVALLAIEKERTEALNNDVVIDAFAKAHKNRRILLL